LSYRKAHVHKLCNGKRLCFAFFDFPSHQPKGVIRMIISVRKCLSTLKFLLVFAALTYALYQLFSLIGAWITPVDHYRIPEGHAVKAFHPSDQAPAGEMMGDRLRFFYWYGE